MFETGSINGKYDSVTRYKDGPVVNGERIRQITYGRSQTTEFGNLKRLLEKYIEQGGAYATPFRPYISKIGKQPSLESNAAFIQLLKDAARNDAAMRQCQDSFFDSYYYQPAYSWFQGFGFTEALSLLVIYDSFIHSGQIRSDIRQRFAERPPVSGGNEREWVKQYVNARHNWLANHSNSLLHATVYRTNCFKKQVTNSNWNLAQPINANGTTVA